MTDIEQKKKICDEVTKTRPMPMADVYEAMGRWAKQEAIEFGEWAAEKGWEKHIGENLWYNIMGYATEFTTEQLYDLYFKDKQSKC